MVLRELRRIDGVAYLRFASVYRHFKQVEDFAKELEQFTLIKETVKEVKPEFLLKKN